MSREMLSAIGQLAEVLVGIPSLICAQGAWIVGGAASPTKITAPSPPGSQQRSVSKSGFQLLSDQMLPAWSITTFVRRIIGAKLGGAGGGPYNGCPLCSKTWL